MNRLGSELSGKSKIGRLFKARWRKIQQVDLLQYSKNKRMLKMLILIDQLPVDSLDKDQIQY